MTEPQKKPDQAKILSEIASISMIALGDRLQIIVTVENQAIAQQLSASIAFHTKIHDICQEKQCQLGFWRIVDHAGKTLARSPDHPLGHDRDESPESIAAIAQEFIGNDPLSKSRAMASIIKSITAEIFGVAAQDPEVQAQAGRMFMFCFGTDKPSVITHHPDHLIVRPTDNCFLCANNLNEEIEALSYKDLEENPDFTAPMNLAGRSTPVIAHWGHQPQRRIDLVQQLYQDGKADAFTYEWINPRGQVVRGVLDYKMFRVGQLLFRVSHHLDLKIVANAA